MLFLTPVCWFEQSACLLRGLRGNSDASPGKGCWGGRAGLGAQAPAAPAWLTGPWNCWEATRKPGSLCACGLRVTGA